ncbi:MAG: OmpA family protein [Sandaracinaceae bacterium]
MSDAPLWWRYAATRRRTILGALALCLANCAGRASSAPARLPPSAVAEQAPPPAASSCEWLHLPLLIRFSPQSAALDADEEATLRELHALMEERGFSALRVEGHARRCDEADPGPLSQQRAEVVAHALRSSGVRARVEIAPLGASQPRADVFPCTAEGRRSYLEATQLMIANDARVEFAVLGCP